MERKNRCCIATCRGERFDLSHKFPRSQEVAEAWLNAINNPNLKKVSFKKLSESYQVCARHFRVSDYKHSQSRNLNKLAVPSLNLRDLSQLNLAKNTTPPETGITSSTIQKHYSIDEIIESSIENENENEQCFVEVHPHPASCLESNEDRHAFHVDKYDSVESIEAPPVVVPDLADCNQNQSYSNLEYIDDDKPPEDYSFFFDIVHPKLGKQLRLNAFWLRCNCECSECCDAITKRKSFTPMDISKHIQPKEISYVEDTNILMVEWTDGHCSSHDIELLFEINRKQIKQKRLTFDSSIFGKHAQVQVLKLITLNDTINYIFENLIQRGFVCVTEISTQNSTMARLVIERLFPQLQNITFKPFNEIHSEICTNITCSNFDCGLKCFFALQKTEIILVDGLKVADTLEESSAQSFKILTETKCSMNIRDNNLNHEISIPIFEIDNEIERNIKVQLDMHRCGKINFLSQDKIGCFYRSLEQLMALIKSAKNQVSLTLEAGTMVILNNKRVLHQLLSGTGVLQTYISRNDFIGRARYFELL